MDKTYIHKNEGWVNFRRSTLKNGFIDIWSGDMADDPNREKENQINLNAFCTFYRKDGIGKWISKREFREMNLEQIYEKLDSINNS